MSPDDDVRPVAGFEQRVRAAVDGDEDGLEVADVVADDREILLVAGPAGDDERVPVPEAGPQLRELDALREQLPLLPQVAHRVVRERFERLRHAALLLAEELLELGSS